jgi:hypothetical protein
METWPTACVSGEPTVDEYAAHVVVVWVYSKPKVSSYHMGPEQPSAGSGPSTRDPGPPTWAANHWTPRSRRVRHGLRASSPTATAELTTDPSAAGIFTASDYP